jgi:hypothetical protein
MVRSLIISTLHQVSLGWSNEGACSTNGEMINGYRIVVGMSEGKRPLERPESRWEGSIRVDRTEIGCVGVDWVNLPQDVEQRRAFVNALMNMVS